MFCRCLISLLNPIASLFWLVMLWLCAPKRDSFRSPGGNGCLHLTHLPTAGVCWLNCTSWLIWKHIPLSYLYSTALSSEISNSAVYYSRCFRAIQNTCGGRPYNIMHELSLLAALYPILQPAVLACLLLSKTLTPLGVNIFFSTFFFFFCSLHYPTDFVLQKEAPISQCSNNHAVVLMQCFSYK